MSKLYRTVITVCDRFVPNKFRPLWEHEAGPKTIFFWAPAVKWALVLASIDDFRRPVEKLSVKQSGILAASGIIWTKFCLEIKPKNYPLSLCNFCLGIANSVQTFRAMKYQHQQSQSDLLSSD